MGMLADRRRMLLASENFSALSQQPSSIAVYMALSDDRDIAFHEAGHGVASIVLDSSLQDVSISPADGTDGRCTYRMTLRQSLEQGGIHRALQEGICLMAGPAAELRFNGAADLLSAAKMDRQQLCEMSHLISQEMFVAAARLMRSGGLSFDEGLPLRIQQWAWREACLMIANPTIWRAVASLARHLEMDETVTVSEVSAIVQSNNVRYKPKQFPAPKFASRPADIAA